MAVGDVYLLSVNSSHLGSLRQMVLAFRREDADPVDAALFTDLAVAAKQIYRDLQHPGVLYSGWRARQVVGSPVTYPASGDICGPVGGAVFEGTYTTLVNGGSSDGTDPLPPQCSIVTTHRSGLAGRRYRGRSYGYGLQEAHQSGGVWTTTILGTIDSNWGAFYDAYAIATPADGWRFGVWSHRIASGCVQTPGGGHTRPDSPSPATSFTPFTENVTRSTVFTQRRRVAGFGL